MPYSVLYINKDAGNFFGDVTPMNIEGLHIYPLDKWLLYGLVVALGDRLTYVGALRDFNRLEINFSSYHIMIAHVEPKTLKEIHKMSLIHGVPYLITTGESPERIVRLDDLNDLIFDDFGVPILQKPFSFRTLQNAMERIIRKNTQNFNKPNFNKPIASLASLLETRSRL